MKGRLIPRGRTDSLRGSKKASDGAGRRPRLPKYRQVIPLHPFPPRQGYGRQVGATGDMRDRSAWATTVRKGNRLPTWKQSLKAARRGGETDVPFDRAQYGCLVAVGRRAHDAHGLRRGGSDRPRPPQRGLASVGCRGAQAPARPQRGSKGPQRGLNPSSVCGRTGPSGCLADGLNLGGSSYVSL